MRAESVFAALREANPEPDVAYFDEMRMSGIAFLSATKERNKPMTETTKDSQPTRGQPAPAPTRPHPIRLQREPRGRGPMIAIAVVVLVIGAAAAILTVIRGGGDAVSTSPTAAVAQAAQPGPIASFEDVAGTYLRRGGAANPYLLILEDGTVHVSLRKDLIIENPETVIETRFEGTRVFVTTTSAMCDQPDRGATYEVRVLNGGNLQFAAVDEDTCEIRSAVLVGRGGDVEAVEFELSP